MAYTKWNEIYEREGGKYGNGDDAGNQHAWDAAWDWYWNADPATRDNSILPNFQERAGEYENPYWYSNDKIANEFDQEDQYGNSKLKTNNKYRIERESENPNNIIWNNGDDNQSYQYKEGKLYLDNNEILDQDIINKFNEDLNNNISAFGNYDMGKSAYDYYEKEHNITFDEARNSLSPKAMHEFNTGGEGKVNSIHSKGLGDLQVRSNPIDEAYTQSDANDLANIFRNDNYIGWKQGYSKKDDTVRDDNNNRTNAQAYADNALLRDNFFIDQEIEKGNPGIIFSIADGDIERAQEIARQTAENFGGYLSSKDRDFLNQFPFTLTEPISTLNKYINSSKDSFNEMEKKYSEKANELSDEEKNKANSELASANEEIQGYSNLLNNLNKYLDVSSAGLALAAMSDYLNKNDNTYLNTNQNKKQNLIKNYLSGQTGENLYDTYENTSTDNENNNLSFIPSDSYIEAITPSKDKPIDIDWSSIVKPNDIFVEKEKALDTLKKYAQLQNPSELDQTKAALMLLEPTKYIDNKVNDNYFAYVPKSDVENIFKRSGYNIRKDK